MDVDTVLLEMGGHLRSEYHPHQLPSQAGQLVVCLEDQGPEDGEMVSTWGMQFPPNPHHQPERWQADEELQGQTHSYYCDKDSGAVQDEM